MRTSVALAMAILKPYRRRLGKQVTWVKPDDKAFGEQYERVERNPAEFGQVRALSLTVKQRAAKFSVAMMNGACQTRLRETLQFSAARVKLNVSQSAKKYFT